MQYQKELNVSKLYISSIQNLLKNEKKRSRNYSAKSNRLPIIRQYLSEIGNPQERNTVHKIQNHSFDLFYN